MGILRTALVSTYQSAPKPEPNLTYMNLFFLAWNLSEAKLPVVLSEIERMKAVYQLLDSSTIWSFGEGSSVFAASMHTAKKVAAPRVYVERSENQVVLFDTLRALLRRRFLRDKNP